MDTNVHEIWLPIPNYEGLYEVSNLGRVKSLARFIERGKAKKFPIKESILRPQKNTSGYFGVALYKDKKVKLSVVHRLVAESFIPNPEKKETVNHKNSIRTDNRTENLEWASHQENMHHAFINGRMAKGERSGRAKLTITQVEYIRKHYIKGENSPSLAKMFNVCKRTISQIANGRAWATSFEN